MLVYRFMSVKYGLDSLQKKQLRVGRLNDLNDPYDCKPILTNVPKSDSGNPDDFRSRFLTTMERSVGLLSFSKTRKDPVVWSHYADKHKGLAFEFDYHNPADMQNVREFMPLEERLTKVEYEKERATIDHDALLRAWDNHDTEELVRIMSESYSRKGLSWQYEEEYRFFVHLGVCEPSGNDYLYKFPQQRLRSVILGEQCKMDAGDIRNSLRHVGLEGVAVHRAKLHPTQYEMIIPELDQRVDK